MFRLELREAVQQLVESTQRGPGVARHERGSAATLTGVPDVLLHQQTRDRLNTGE
jgi:hypothetical protein